MPCSQGPFRQRSQRREEAARQLYASGCSGFGGGAVSHVGRYKIKAENHSLPVGLHVRALQLAGPKGDLAGVAGERVRRLIGSHGVWRLSLVRVLCKEGDESGRRKSRGRRFRSWRGQRANGESRRQRGIAVRSTQWRDWGESKGW